MASRLFDESLRVGLGVHLDRSKERALHSGATLPGITITVKVDRNESIPLHDQVAAEIRRAIADGEAKPGERLPPARDLAAVLKVNSNTVFRALRILRDEGLLEFRRGRGITVTGAAPKRSPVIAMARDLVRVARRHGVRRDELIQIIEGLS
jgi:GntR family transcriptional regulator